MTRVSCWFVLVIVLLMMGCSPSEVNVTGTVTLDGQPLDEGFIIFRLEPITANSQAVSVPIRNGQFQAKARPGKNRVEIIKNNAPPSSRSPKDVPFSFAPILPPKSLIPAKYNVNTELSADVQANGQNNFEFKLTSK